MTNEFFIFVFQPHRDGWKKIKWWIEKVQVKKQQVSLVNSITIYGLKAK